MTLVLHNGKSFLIVNRDIYMTYGITNTDNTYITLITHTEVPNHV